MLGQSLASEERELILRSFGKSTVMVSNYCAIKSYSSCFLGFLSFFLHPPDIPEIKRLFNA